VGASQTVHFYEAWLATLAIIVWHGFFVMFHPDQYPMSWIWLTGRMSEEEAQHHHPEWYEDLVGEATGDSDDAVEPAAVPMDKT
jgi:cytochrome b subunit of formate dehydrogenase